MKRNVDLTENRFFGSNFSFGILKIASILKSDYPWTRYLEEFTDSYFRHQNESVIALGDKKERAKIENLHQMDSLDYCDCCGVRMNLKPWDREIGVCHRCNNYYEKDKDKCLWRKKEFIKNATIRIA